MRVLISAGEASSEMYGARLIEALRRRAPDSDFFGVGGEKMRAAGCKVVVDARDLAVVGITEILPHLASIYARFRRLIAEADRRKPEFAVVIDSPAFNLRVAREMHRRGIPVFYYVAPQFWAWRQWRVKKIRKYIRKALVIFPFEEQWYHERGVDAEFVGHPLADLEPTAVTREEFARANGLGPEKPWIALLPGSRRKEVRMHLQTLLEAARLLGGAFEYVLPVASTLDRSSVVTQVGRAPVKIVSDARAALKHSRVAAVASGTATVEAALMGTPFVMIYRVSGLSYAIGRPLVRLPHFAMVNLIAGKKIVPEFVQRDFTAANIVAKLRELIPDGLAREKMTGDLATVRSRLRAGNNDRPAAERAAESILRALSAAAAPGSNG